jgi:hypothetical protein
MDSFIVNVFQKLLMPFFCALFETVYLETRENKNVICFFFSCDKIGTSSCFSSFLACSSTRDAKGCMIIVFDSQKIQFIIISEKISISFKHIFKDFFN